ncbi:MAG: hypothetical protein ACETWE_11630 [Candidatus Bathyarchaeia archaeon]
MEEELNQTFVDTEETGEEHRFIVYFLYDDEDQTVYVEEAEEIDLSKVFQHLNLGGSIFITHRRNPRETSVLEEKAQRNAR